MTRARDLAAFVSNADGDIKFDTDTLFIDSSANRVGIGSTSPSSALHVEGDATTLTLRDDSSYSAGTGPYLQFQGLDSGGTNRNFAQIAGLSNGSNSGDLIINTRNSGTTAERIRVKNDGKVGVGLTNPADFYADDLVVQATSEGGITIKSHATSATNYLVFADGTSGNEAYRGYIGYTHNDTPANESLQIVSTGRMRFYTSTNGSTSTERWNITADGNLKALVNGNGIDFSATENTTSGTSVSSSILDDYEEGTFTPTLSIGGVTLASTGGVGRYTKIGRKVYIEGSVTRNTASGSSGTILVHGLPYTILNADSIGVLGAGTFWMDQGNASTDTVAHVYAAGGNTYFQGVRSTSTGARANSRYADASELSNGRPIYFNFSYVVA
jgi:hypothetical protein